MNVLSLLKNHAATKRAVFISPHLDDAAFSAGGILAFLSKLNLPVLVINVFTSPGNGNGETLSSRKFLSQCKDADPVRLFSKRLAEDSRIFLTLKNTKVINLGLVDALWRLSKSAHPLTRFLGKLAPEFLRAYPTYRWHISTGKISPNDSLTVDELFRTIKKHVRQKDLIFCPLGIGKHVDHLIVRDACTKLENTKVYWADHPYQLIHSADQDFIHRHQLQRFVFSQFKKAKGLLIKGYKTQVEPVFGTTDPLIEPDILYSRSK